ncbi:MAG: SpoIIE family protein phosphatase [Oscillospiraceae bacterium]|jgi:sigma-B regulation protein RsbU (phosphoserine phosphatase)|nr:SpoIIE family protein phosphatase [Oscillospiraceae bacterium]
MKTKSGKLGRRMIIIFTAFALILIFIVSGVIIFGLYEDNLTFFGELAQTAAGEIAERVKGDDILYWLETRDTNDEYAGLLDDMYLLQSTIGSKYLYIYVPTETGLVFVADAAEISGEGLIRKLGDVFSFDEVSSEAESIAQFGQLAHAEMPILNANGETVAFAAADMSVDYISHNVFKALLYFAPALIIMFALFIIALGLIINRKVSRPLAVITYGVEQFVQGDVLKFEADVKTGDEIQELSEAFAKIAVDIQEYMNRMVNVAADEERIAGEMTLMRSIEDSVLPKPIVERDDYSAAGLTHPSHDIGSSFYDYFHIDNDRLGIVAAEMKSEGISGALYMIAAKTMIKMEMMRASEIGESVKALNTEMYDAWQGKASISAFLGVLDLSKGVLHYVNADFANPIHQKVTGPFEYLPQSLSQALAVNRNVSFREMVREFAEGDRLLLLTRDMLEAEHDGKRFAERQLPLSLDNVRGVKSADTVTAELMNVFDKYTDERSGNVTVLSVVYYGNGKSRIELVVQPRSESFRVEILPQIKKLLEANGMGKAFYAEYAVSLEELFIICAHRIQGSGNTITLQCSAVPGAVSVRLIFKGAVVSPLESENIRETSALEFIRSLGCTLDYEASFSTNIVTLARSVVNFGAEESTELVSSGVILPDSESSVE